MSASLYEIVELSDGTVGLRRAGEDEGEPLVSIKFSAEAERYLHDMRFDVIKTMIEAGLEAIGDMADEEPEEWELDALESEVRTLH